MLVDIMARLRGPQGCPWDREQTLASLRSFVLEETHEVLDAIDPDKDVDGFHIVNVGRLATGMPGLVPCTPAGVIELIAELSVVVSTLGNYDVRATDTYGHLAGDYVLKHLATVIKSRIRRDRSDPVA